MKNANPENIQNNLAQFICTENYYRNPFHGKLLYTDGVKYLADNAGAYWLLDIIASYQPTLLKQQTFREYQFWHLKVHPNRSATLICRADSNVPPVLTEQIEFSDFPLPEIDLWVVSDGAHGMVAMLKSEY